MSTKQQQTSPPSVSDSIDARSAGGKLLLNVLMSVAQQEREAIPCVRSCQAVLADTPPYIPRPHADRRFIFLFYFGTQSEIVESPMDSHTEDSLSFEEHLAFWCITEDFELPAEEQLIIDTRFIVETNFALDQELRDQGMAACPIWECGGEQAGVFLRNAALPEPFLNTYFTEAENDLRDPNIHRLIARLLPHFFADISVATAALDDTLRLWIDPEAPTRQLKIPYHGHYMMVSAMLLDLARKGSCGMNLQEWLASLGTAELFCSPQTVPSFAELHESMHRKLEQLWELEDSWLAE